jgi:hypothetical protein
MRHFIPKTIKARCISFDPIGYYDDINSPWYGYANKWKAQYIISTPQTHSDSRTPTPYEYNGLDIAVGDWSAGGDGLAVRIIEVIEENFSFGGVNYISPSPNAITVVVEDIESFNLLNDPTQTGTNFSDNINWIFSLSDDGTPMLNYIPAFDIPVNFHATLLARFQNRNLVKTDYLVLQAHNFTIGDILYISNVGLYNTLSANSIDKNNFERIVGQVASIGTSGTDSFTFRPRGSIVTDITQGNIGDILYLDPDTPGLLTTTKPSKFPLAFYIKLDSTNAIYLSGGGGAGSSGPLGYNASVYKMGTIAERDAIDTEQLQIGDLVYVADTGNGEWAMFMWAGVIGVTPTWYTLADYDSSTTDAKTKTVELFYSQNQPLNIWSIGETARVVDITVEVIQTFHTTATLTVGDDSVNNRLMDSDDVDLSVPGKYSVTPSYQYGGTGEPLIKAYYNPGSSTQGEAKITLTYV